MFTSIAPVYTGQRLSKTKKEVKRVRLAGIGIGGKRVF